MAGRKCLPAPSFCCGRHGSKSRAVGRGDAAPAGRSRSPQANRRAANAARLASAQAPATSAVSILIPGPIAALIATFWTYLPLAPVALAFTPASPRAATFTTDERRDRETGV